VKIHQYEEIYTSAGNKKTWEYHISSSIEKSTARRRGFEEKMEQNAMKSGLNVAYSAKWTFIQGNQRRDTTCFQNHAAAEHTSVDTL